MGRLSQAQIDGAAGFIPEPSALVRIALAIALDVVEGPLHDHRQFVGKGGFERGQAVLANANERRADGLVRTAFGGQRDTRRCADKNETCILVTCVVQRIEPAATKGS